MSGAYSEAEFSWVNMVCIYFLIFNKKKSISTGRIDVMLKRCRPEVRVHNMAWLQETKCRQVFNSQTQLPIFVLIKKKYLWL